MNRHLAVSLLVAVICSVAALAQEKSPELLDYERYLEKYPWTSHLGLPQTFDRVFEWPEGYRRLDSAGLTHYQHWVSYLPMWPKGRPVGAHHAGILYKAEQISRSFDLPWRAIEFVHFSIPLQLLLEYDIVFKSEFAFEADPKKGETIRYGDWLKSRVLYDAWDSVYLAPAEEREPSRKELIRFFGHVIVNSNYRSLAINCDSVPETDIKPGDMLIAHERTGEWGVVYIVMCVIVNDAGDKLYIVGTGCADACDFHIPLFNDNNDYPWITLEQMKALVPEEFPNRGFFRFKRQ